MQIFSKGITILHISLFVFFTLIWLAFADAYKVPKFMLSYLFPYDFAFRGMGASTFYIFVFQVLVVISYLAAVRKKDKMFITNSIATIMAIFWFLFANLSVVSAHLH